MYAKPIAAAVAVLLLAACAPEIESTIYVSDVLKAAGGETVEVPAVLRIPQSSGDECTAGLDRLIENLKVLSPVTGKGKCVTNDKGDELAEIETSLYVLRFGTDVPEGTLLVIDVDDEFASTGGYLLTFRMQKTLDEITTALQAGSQTVETEFDPAKFIFKLENDTEGDVAIYPDHVFADGKATMFNAVAPTTLGRRKSVTLVLSDVASEHVSAANSYSFAEVSPR